MPTKTKYTKEQLLNKRVFDYTFVIAFFLIASFFTFFAIKPNLETGFKLQRELEELKQIDQNYNTAINTILRIQSSIEQNRDSLSLLNQALPSNPEVNKIIGDIQKTASTSGVTLTSLAVVETPINNPHTNKSVKNFHVTFQSKSDFAAVQQFISSFLSERRLKLVDKLDITKDPREASGSAALGISFEIESYYL